MTGRKFMKCNYTYTFPVDEWGRIGGLYSLADVPIHRYEEMTRPGIVTDSDPKNKLYKVSDNELNRDFVLEWDKVEILDVIYKDI